MPFTLTSTTFSDSGMIPTECTCEGADRSPALQWGGAPLNTKSFALIMDDPDAPRGTFTHWVLFDIPAASQGLDAGQPAVGVAGVNDFQEPGYRGPCPPPGHGEHRYVFTLYALDVETLGLGQTARRVEVEGAMNGHVIGKAQLMGRYKRRERTASV
ncbi:MAG TPA: YbhB/YbcL family Raf kinase inhibitor-like protein [Roseiflexaceae bacterium]|nr:YbhB/YbcL family Raf kinase inhibitor-like protein [Roseiflexaceae bacterium]